MGRDINHTWHRGERGWGSGPDSDVTEFQQNPPLLLGLSRSYTEDQYLEDLSEEAFTVLDETTADMFLNWVYRRITDNTSMNYLLPADYGFLLSARPINTDGSIWRGFLNRTWRNNANGDPDSSMPGNARYVWFDVLMTAILTEKGWLQ